MEELVGNLISVEFDDLMRHQEHYDRFAVDHEFLAFVAHQQNFVVKRWQEAEHECARLQTEVENTQKELAKSNTKIQTVRRNLETKIEIQAQLEADRQKLIFNTDSAKALIREYLNDSRTTQEARNRILNILAVLDGGSADFVLGKKTDKNSKVLRSTDTISEANSTDLSITQSEDDLDISVAGHRALGNRRRRSNRRPSLEYKEGRQLKPSAASNNQPTKQSVEVSTHDEIIVKTVLKPSKGGHGPVTAIASIETTPKISEHQNQKMSRRYFSQDELSIIQSETESDASSMQRLPNTRSRAMTASYTPKPGSSFLMSPVVAARTRPHSWAQKTVIKPEICEPCGRRLKFSKPAFKCRDCRAICHIECKEQVPLPCVLAATATPSSSKSQMTTVADYAPLTHPMVPALIQHCTNAIEARGETVVGLYRVSGGEKESKELKERFLRKKGVPNLDRYGVHVICGCIKDFLKSLSEPLLGRWVWRDFTVAASIADPEKRLRELEKLVTDLPPANQETLAFLMLHLQKIAEMREVKMPMSNLAKIFGPTVVGYSSNDLDGPSMLRETKKQQQVMEAFVTAPSAFWEGILARENKKVVYVDRKHSTVSVESMTPSHSSLGRARERSSSSKRSRYFDDSPKEPRPAKLANKNKNYFD